LALSANGYFQILNFASYGDEQAILLQILSLSITPTMIITKLLISQMLDELSKSYAELALAKGLSFRRIIFVHVLRNTIYSLFHYSLGAGTLRILVFHVLKHLIQKLIILLSSS
jgi:ABC-type dipeptide/oligopeptide/nickel transport system permease component